MFVRNIIIASVASGAVLYAVVPRDAVAPARDTTDATVVTTDSPAYCHTLEHTIDARALGGVQTVRDLEREGARLCDSGHVRPGIDRLRQALRELRHS